MNQPISRRTVLKGLGTAIALPLLESMLPLRALAGTGAATKFPRRMAFFYIPNGVNMQSWTPAAVGSSFELTPILQPLAPFQNDILVLSGLALDKARANGDGAGDHARAMASFLTGRQARKTSGADIRIGISVDQVAANEIGKRTRFPSLELGCEGGRQAGNCDSGYSCAYSSNLSWRGEATPNAKEVDPKLVFDRLFEGENRNESAEARAKRESYRKSILDLVSEDAKDLEKQLGGGDRRKLDEYFSAIRELEQRIAHAREFAQQATAELTRPTGIPKDRGDHARLLADLLALSFQGDLTRVATFVLANDGSNYAYRNIGVADGHHDLSHHQGNREKLAKIEKINRFHMEQFAYLLCKLKSIREGEGTLLDNCMLVYGSGIGDGNRHNHDNLPILLAGKGGGTITTGRHVRYPRETPLTNLYVSLLERVGAPVKSFGDSKGPLTDLEG